MVARYRLPGMLPMSLCYARSVALPTQCCERNGRENNIRLIYCASLSTFSFLRCLGFGLFHAGTTSVSCSSAKDRITLTPPLPGPPPGPLSLVQPCMHRKKQTGFRGKGVIPSEARAPPSHTISTAQPHLCKLLLPPVHHFPSVLPQVYGPNAEERGAVMARPLGVLVLILGLGDHEEWAHSAGCNQGRSGKPIMPQKVGKPVHESPHA